MSKVITARYPGKCRKCGKGITAGERIRFFGAKHSEHLTCGESSSDQSSGQSAPGSSATVGKQGRFVIDWHDLRNTVIDGMKGIFPQFKVNRNLGTFKELVQRDDTGFRGYSKAQAKEWAESGYETDALADLTDFSPPIREKRRFVYGEEGDEIDLSAAWAGEDNYMTHWTKRDSIPGVSLEFNMTFSAYVRAEVVNKFIHWIAQAVYAIESAGIDPEISVAFPTAWRWSNKHNGGRTVIRVKNAMETVDQNFWSAMLSPAAFRTFGFAAIVLAADSVNSFCDAGIDAPGSSEWNVIYDPEEQVIRVTSPASASMFPELEMTDKLRKAIEHLKGNYSE